MVDVNLNTKRGEYLTLKASAVPHMTEQFNCHLWPRIKIRNWRKNSNCQTHYQQPYKLQILVYWLLMITFRKRGHSSARRKEVGRRHQYRWWTQNLVGFSLEGHQAQIKEFRSSKQFSDDWQLQRLRARHREVLKTRYDWDRHIWSAREQCFWCFQEDRHR